MANATIRISEKSRVTLRELAAQSGETMQVIADRAIEKYRRQRFFEELNAGYAALRQDHEAWADYQKEMAIWDCTLMDGLDPNEIWHEDGTVTYRNREDTA